MYKLEVGKRYGQRVSIKLRTKNRRQELLMRCDCGRNETWCRPKNARKHTKCLCCAVDERGRNKATRHTAAIKAMVGEHIGQRKVMATKVVRGLHKLLMRCNCGRDNTWMVLQAAQNHKMCSLCSSEIRQVASRLKAAVGERHGSRVIIKIEMRKQQYWLMRCDCGDETWAQATKSWVPDVCSRCAAKVRQVASRLKAAVGERHGSRAIINIEMRNGAQWWLMRCDCGDENWVLASQLTKLNTIRCKMCSNTLNANLRRHPNLQEEDLQRLLALSSTKKKLKEMTAHA